MHDRLYRMLQGILQLRRSGKMFYFRASKIYLLQWGDGPPPVETPKALFYVNARTTGAQLANNRLYWKSGSNWVAVNLAAT